MKTSRFAALSVIAVVVIGASSAFAAPCESVESAAASGGVPCRKVAAE